MPKPQKRKETPFEPNQVRSLFFTGDPNEGKRENLVKLQTAYTDSVNTFVELLENTPSVLIPVVKNDKHDSEMRKLEKAHRSAVLGSAMSQAAFDDAVSMLSNRYERVLQEMRSIRYDMFTSSKILFCMSVQEKSKAEMAQAMNDIGNKVKKNREFYLDTAAKLTEMPQRDFDFRMEEFALSYADASAIFRIPHTDKMWVSLDSRTCKLEEADHIKASHVIQITDPMKRGDRVSVPLMTSENSIRRMRQYGYAKSCRYTITDNGRLRVSIAFKKHMDKPETDKVVGVDTGILDCFYTSDGKHIGTFKEVEDYYKTVVEPSLAQLSTLRNKKRSILHFVHTHKNLPASVRRSLLDKVDFLEGMIQAAKEPAHKLRVYHHRLEMEISKTVNSYIDSIDKSTLTALELLDIKEFNKSRKANGKLSMFARGQLQKKLMERLNWHGYDFVEVDPAYTSQLCPVCSHVAKENRQGKQFRCVCCGYEQDADFNASGNIKARVDDAEIRQACEENKYNKENRHKTLKKIYEERHKKWLEQTKTDGGKSSAPQQARHI